MLGPNESVALAAYHLLGHVAIKELYPAVQAEVDYVNQISLIWTIPLRKGNCDQVGDGNKRHTV